MVRCGTRTGCALAALALALAVCAPRARGQDVAGKTLRVDESKCAVRFSPQGQAVVTLFVENPSLRSLPARIRLELLDPSNQILVSSGSVESLRPGGHRVVIPFALAPPATRGNPPDATLKLILDRLRYRVDAQSADGAPAPAEGIMSLSEILADAFQLHMVAQGRAKPGAEYRVTVIADHPPNSRGLAGVSLFASLGPTDESGAARQVRSAATDSRGAAALAFVLPGEPGAERYDLKITGTKAGLAFDMETEVVVNGLGRLEVHTDKTLYQPGQTLHARLLAFDTRPRAVAAAPVTFSVYDPENTLVQEVQAVTSRFGIASMDWQIPENERLGEYRVKATVSMGEGDSYPASVTVRLSRYELPAFKVSVKLDRAFYLPGQRPVAVVHGDYLFGQPVSAGHVRVVREVERNWNYRQQKWEIRAGQSEEGETDSTGHFTARLDLDSAYQQFAGDPSERYLDLHYAAYFTDRSTGRTEQRRFDVRATREPIHIYLIARYQHSFTAPEPRYVSTSYADGTPVSCRVVIDGHAQDERASHPRISIARIHTNRYGVARIPAFSVPQDWREGYTLLLSADDSKGGVGTREEPLAFSEYRQINLAAGKAIYPPGDPVEISLFSNLPDGRLAVQAIRDGEILASQEVALVHGRATARIDSDRRFAGQVNLLAFPVSLATTNEDDWNVSGTTTILFPHPHGLKLDISVPRGTLLPGEQASAAFRVQTVDGTPVVSALGLVVVDQAVREREQTDEGFGSAWSVRRYSESRSLAGVRISDLEDLDLSKPVPDDLDLAAQILLLDEDLLAWTVNSEVGPRDADFGTAFRPRMEEQLRSVVNAVKIIRNHSPISPVEHAPLEDVLSLLGISEYGLRDPWGSSYTATVLVSGGSERLQIVSPGPDKRIGTSDDVVALEVGFSYFEDVKGALERAATEYYERTGEFLRDEEATKRELRLEDIQFDALRDPWGRPYRLQFDIRGVFYEIRIVSAGADGVFNSADHPSWDDVVVVTNFTDYFSGWRARISNAVSRFSESTGEAPKNDAEFRKALSAANVDWDALHDPWGHPYYVAYDKRVFRGDRLVITKRTVFGQAEQPTRKLTPVSISYRLIRVRSAGPDGREGSEDDFDVAQLTAILGQQSAADFSLRNEQNPSANVQGTGAISGIVIDPSGATISGAKVFVFQGDEDRSAAGQATSALTDAEGRFRVDHLPTGLYSVRIEMRGFQTSRFISVPVQTGVNTEIDAELELGTVMEVIEVSATPAAELQTLSSSVGQARVPAATAGAAPGLSTPRLREYFPETLLWQPELITDARGRARLRFPLADTITTWTLSATASTLDGQIRTAEKQIRAFQPFFLDHDPPRFLTAGDRIALPLVLRNYLDHEQSVTWTVKPEKWFTPDGPAAGIERVAPRDSARGVFTFTAISPVADGKLRVTAASASTGDAVEKSVNVRPDGREVVETSAQLFHSQAALALRLPPNAIPGTLRAELKLYPNLLAHVVESIEAILGRPAGCGEQIISTAYPSLLFLRYARAAGVPPSPHSAQAQHYLDIGYESLLALRAPGGGFTYWGSGEADTALTAYALQFLRDAHGFISVDDSLIQETTGWLVGRMREDGTWRPRYGSERPGDRETAILTAYVTRVLSEELAATGSRGATPAAQLPAASLSRLSVVRSSVGRALMFVAAAAREMDEPYLIASLALAAQNAGDPQVASNALVRLRSLAREEGTGTYWALEANSPFYSWGLPGRLEVTALVLRALARSLGPDSETGDAQLLSRGLLFLLKNQDRYGVWYSGQVTVNVLQAMLAQLDTQPSSAGPSRAEVRINGKSAFGLGLPSTRTPAPPLVRDITTFLQPGENRVEVLGQGNAGALSLEIVTRYYVPWARGAAAADIAIRPGESETLRFGVHYSQTAAHIGEAVECSVEAERIGFRGYGMMLAEVGIPPGAEVDRASLERAQDESGWALNHYDVQPDRIILYLWPSAGGIRLKFVFRLRYAETAQAPASTLYDYYNEQARVLIAPARFVVQ